MQDWANETEGVGAKLEQLNSILDAQKSKLKLSQAEHTKYAKQLQELDAEIEDLNRQKQRAIELYGKESDEVKNINTQLKKSQREYNYTTTQLDKLNVAVLKQQADINRTEKSIASYENKLEELNNTNEKVEKSTEDLSDGFTVMKGAMANLVADGISFVIDKTVELVTSLLDLTEATEEYRSMMGKLEASATNYGASVDYVMGKYREMYSYLGDDQMATNAVTNMIGLNASTENMSKLLDGAIGVWASYGDSIPIESLTEAINETIQAQKVTGTFADTIMWNANASRDLESALSGNSTALQTFKTALQEGETAEDAFNLALEKITSEEERATVVAEYLNTAYGESKKTYDEVNQAILDMNESEQKLKETQAELGEAMVPVHTVFNDFKTQALEGIVPLVDKAVAGFLMLTDTVKGLMSGEISFKDLFGGIATGVQEAVPELLSNGLTMLENFADMLTENVPILVENGMEFIRNLVRGLMDSLPELISRVPEIISQFANVINDNAPTIIKAGFGIILDIIKGLLNAIPTLIASIPEIITAIVDVWEAFNWIDLGKKAIKHLGDGIKAMIEFVKTNATSVKDNIVNIIKTLPSNLYTWGKNAVSNLGQAIRDMISTAVASAKQLSDGIVGKIKEVLSWDNLKQIGKNLVEGLWNGISDMTGWVLGKIQGFTSGVLDGIKDFFGVHSPSDETYWIGEMLDKGLGNAIADGVKGVKSKAEMLANAVLDTLHDNLDTVEVSPDLLNSFKSDAVRLNGKLNPAFAGASVGSTTNVVFNQYNNSPKPIDSLQTYLNTDRQLKQFKKWRGR